MFEKKERLCTIGNKAGKLTTSNSMISTTLRSYYDFVVLGGFVEVRTRTGISIAVTAVVGRGDALLVVRVNKFEFDSRVRTSTG